MTEKNTQNVVCLMNFGILFIYLLDKINYSLVFSRHFVYLRKMRDATLVVQMGEMNISSPWIWYRYLLT